MKHHAYVHSAAREGYDPAIDHVGWVQPIGTHGKPIEEMHPSPDSPPVAGWCGRCECGWQGAKYYPREKFPPADNANPHPDPPMSVVSGTLTGVEAEWHRHILDAVPELFAFDLIRDCRAPLTDPDLRWAVRNARRAGVSWQRIATVTGIPRTDAEKLWGPKRRPPPERPEHRPWPYQGRRPDPPARGPQR